MSRARILITTPNFITAGCGRVILEILRRLDLDSFDPKVCVLRKGGLDVEVEKLGVTVIQGPFTIDIRPRKTLLLRAWRASRHFRDFEIDIWHSWHYLDDYAEPIVARFAGARRWIYTKNNMSWGNNAWRLRSILADRIVADNPQMISGFFSTRALQKKVRLIQHGVDVERFRPVRTARHLLRKRLAIPDGKPLVGCVANLVPVKDHRTLIRAVSKSKSNPHLILIGQGDEGYKTHLQKFAQDLGVSNRVHFLGYVPDEQLTEILGALDMFVLSSKSEAHPVALLEAMACELPCVATRCGGPETIIHEGINGFVVDIGDFNLMASRIDALSASRDLRMQVGQAAREQVILSFNADREAKRYEDLYREIVRV